MVEKSSLSQSVFSLHILFGRIIYVFRTCNNGGNAVIFSLRSEVYVHSKRLVEMRNFCVYLIAGAFLFGESLMAAPHGGDSKVIDIPDVATWKKIDDLKKKLATELIAKLPGIGSKQVIAFTKNPDNLRLLLMFQLVDNEADAKGEYARYNEKLTKSVTQKKDDIVRLENEVKAKSGAEKKRAQYQLSCARKDLIALQQEAKYPAELTKSGKVLKAILSDNEWMEQIAYSGELNNFTRVVQIISAVVAEDAKALRKGVERDTTTAVALEYARHGERLTAAVERAEYFLNTGVKGD